VNSVLVYVGDDPDFVKEMSVMLQERSKGGQKWSLVVLADGPGVLSHVLGLRDVVGVVFDFTPHSQGVSEKFCHEIVMFKNLTQGRTIPLVGVFSDKAQLESLEHLFTLGVTFSHVKGADASVFHRDLIWLARGVQDHLGAFATAKRLDLNYEVTSTAAVVEVSAEEIWFDSDVLPLAESPCRFAAFGEQKPHSIAVGLHHTHSCWHDGFYHGQLLVSYPGPWDTPEESALARDTFETWIGRYEDEPFTDGRAFVLTNNASILEAILVNPVIGDMRVACTDRILELKQHLMALKPHVLCLDLPEDHEVGDYVQVLQSALQDNVDWKPYIVIYNCQLPTHEWRTLIESDRVLSYESRLDVGILKKMLEVSAKKIVPEKQSGKHRFKLNDPARLIEFDLPIYITSLSEHEMTFFCSEEIPMFSVLTLRAPVKTYMLVIPQFRQLSRGPRGVHYQTILHGLSLEEEAVLRQYVNSAIFDRPKVFGELPTTPVPEQVVVAMNQEIKENITPVIPLPVVAQERRVAVGKSKL